MESGGRIAAAERPAAGREHRKYNRGEAADKVAVLGGEVAVVTFMLRVVVQFAP
jgi:hypothetical protein